MPRTRTIHVGSWIPLTKIGDVININSYTGTVVERYKDEILLNDFKGTIVSIKLNPMNKVLHYYVKSSLQ